MAQDPNLPPGVSVSDLPGNRPEDMAWDEFHEWLDEQTIEHNINPEDARQIWERGMPGSPTTGALAENPYPKRERLLKELREECGWEGAILIKIDGKDGASLLCDVDDGATIITLAIVNALGDALPDLVIAAYQGTGAKAVDTIDRYPQPPEETQP